MTSHFHEWIYGPCDYATSPRTRDAICKVPGCLAFTRVEERPEMRYSPEFGPLSAALRAKRRAESE